MALLEVSWKLFWWWRRRRRRRSWQPLRPRERQLAFGGHDMNPSFDFPQTNKSSHDFLPFPAGDGIVFCLAKPNIAQQPRETYSECHRLIYKIFAAYRAKRSVTLFADFLKEFAFAISPAYLKSGDNPQFSVRMQSELSLKHCIFHKTRSKTEEEWGSSPLAQHGATVSWEKVPPPLYYPSGGKGRERIQEKRRRSFLLLLFAFRWRESSSSTHDSALERERGGGGESEGRILLLSPWRRLEQAGRRLPATQQALRPPPPPPLFLGESGLVC